MPPSRRPTLYDVAKLAGVSHVTVSRVVRDSHIVKAATAERVRAAIEQTGYVPDPLLSALAAYRSGSRLEHGNRMAFLESEANNAYSQSVFSGAMAEAERLGYALSRYTLPVAPRQQAALWRTLYHRGIRGILVGPSSDPLVFHKWDWAPFASVSLSTMFHQPALHAVTTDYFTGATRAVSHLQALGAQRIGFAVSATREVRTAHRWLGGYLTAIQKQEPLFYPGPFDQIEPVRDWIVANAIDGLLTIHHTVWNGRPPADIATIFLNHFDCPPTVPCITYDSQQIGIEGVRLIHPLYLNQEFGLPAKVKVVNLQPELKMPELATAQHATSSHSL